MMIALMPFASLAHGFSYSGASIPDGIITPAKTNGELMLTTGVNASDAAAVRTNLEVYSKNESDDLAAQSTLRYYISEAADAVIAGYEQLKTSPITVQASETLAVGTTQTLLDAWISPIGTPNITMLSSGIYEVESYISKSAGANITCTMEFWTRNLAGVETFVASSAPTLFNVAAAVQPGFFRFSVASAITIVNTDRLVLKLYGIRAGAPVSSLTLWYGGVTDAFFGIPISPRNFMRTDASNASAATALVNLGTQPWTAIEKTQALVGSSAVNFAANGITAAGNVLIATTTDDLTNKLQVNGNAAIKNNFPTLKINHTGTNPGTTEILQAYNGANLPTLRVGASTANGTLTTMQIASGTPGRVIIGGGEDDAVSALQVNGFLKTKSGSASSTMVGRILIAAGSTTALETIIPGITVFKGRLTIVDVTNIYTGVLLLRNGGSPTHEEIEDIDSKFAVTDTAGMVCLLYDGDGTFSIKNNSTNMYLEYLYMGSQ